MNLDFMQDRPTLAEVEATRKRAQPKSGMPLPLAKKARAKEKKDKDEAFRDAIWLRDKGCSRATGRKLQHSGLDWDVLGEVDHVINRSVAPDRVYDTSNGILLSKMENRLKKTPCPRAPEHHMFEVEGPDDRAKTQTFIWRDADGKETKRRVG